MSEDLFEYPIKEPWRAYPWFFRPQTSRILLGLAAIICVAGVLISFTEIPRDAQMTTPGLEKVPVAVGISLIILFILPLPCLLVGLLLSLIPIVNVPFKVKFVSFFLLALLFMEGYGLKDLIAATLHG